MRRAALTLAALLALGACQRYANGAEVFGRMPKVRGSHPEEILRHATFATVGGLPREEAIRRLSGDGWTCAATSCAVARLEREHGADLLFGIRPPGPVRTWLREWQVTFLADPVSTPELIEASFASTQADPPQAPR